MKIAQCAIGLGSNLGDSLSILENALQILEKEPFIDIIACSSWYKTKPVGPPQPDYLNGCALLQVTIPPQQLLEVLLKIEQQFGRIRRQKWGPRTLDLDILLFEDLILDTPTLKIPHPYLCQRAFVLVPLAEIIPSWVEPQSKKAIIELVKEIDCSGVEKLANFMSTNSESPEILQQCLFYQGRKFSFEVNKLRLPNGIEGNWECIRHPGGALAVPITPEGKLVLVKQYRFAVSGRLLEFPAGTVESYENPAETIKREIEEETGYKAHSWQNLGKFPLAPGYSDEYIYAFLAKDLEKLAQPPAQDEDEDIEVVLMTPQELETAILEGKSVDAKSITSFFLAKPYLS